MTVELDRKQFPGYKEKVLNRNCEKLLGVNDLQLYTQTENMEWQ